MLNVTSVDRLRTFYSFVLIFLQFYATLASFPTLVALNSTSISHQIADESMRVSNGGVSGGEPVILNIYDMFWTNDYTGNVGLGVYHSGVEERMYNLMVSCLLKIMIMTCP